MIIGTAGHIDHGKTTLVRALTGTDTDRLEEEKKRGITIELGYAYVPTQHGDILGFVDVPGHERLVHTMVAGATGIDFALLVIAADDGIMPQTLEHVAVLELLGIRHGAVVISKADRVHSERIEQLLHSLPSALAHTFLHDAPLFVVDALSEEKPGLAALQTHLAEHAAQHNRQHRSNGHFRLAVDRVFSLAGHGTVVTGTVYGGHYSLDDNSRTLQLLPAKKTVRVRSIHAQNRRSQEAKAGQRCALNLGSIDVHEIKRGDWIADPDCFEPTQRMDVNLRLLPHAALVLNTWSPWHVHIGSAHYLAHAVPLSSTTLQAGEEGFVQLVFEQPVCALPGDRFILRNAQAKETVGGGMVLDTHAPDRKRRSAPRLDWLQTVADSIHTGSWDALMGLAPYGLAETELVRLLGTRELDAVVPDDTVWLTPARSTHTRYLIHRDQLSVLSTKVLNALQQYHDQHPDEPGIGQQRLHRICAPSMPTAVWESLLVQLRATKQITSNGAWLHLPEHRSSLPPEELALAEQLLSRIYAGRFDPPWTRDLAAALALTDTQVRPVLRRLVRLGMLYQIVPDLFYHQQHVAELATIIAELDTHSNESSAIQFRRATQLGRKRAIQVLEFFDRIGYTRRVRNHRLLRGEIWPKPDTL